MKEQSWTEITTRQPKYLEPVQVSIKKQTENYMSEKGSFINQGDGLCLAGTTQKLMK